MGGDDPLKREFEKLDQEAAEIASTRQETTCTGLMVDVHRLKGWGTSVLALFKSVFGENSDYYRKLSAHLEEPVTWLGYEHIFRGAKAIFDAARSSYFGPTFVYRRARVRDAVVLAVYFPPHRGLHPFGSH